MGRDFNGELDHETGRSEPLLLVGELPLLSAPRLDWYGATVPNTEPEELIALILSVWENAKVGNNIWIKGGPRYRNRRTYYDETGPIGQVRWGAKDKPHPHVDVWGVQTERFASALAARHFHRVTRK